MPGRTQISLSTKIDILKELDKPGASLKIVAEKFSTGWLQKFKTRFNIKFKKAHGEKQSADKESADDYIKDILPGILEEYDESDIYNLDEFGILPKGLSNKGHVLGNETPSGLKMSKDRITGCVCTNLSGTDKRPLILVGKSKILAAFLVINQSFPFIIIQVKMHG